MPMRVFTQGVATEAPEAAVDGMALAALALAKVKERFGPEGSSAPAQSGDKNGFVQYGEEALAPDEEEREARREAEWLERAAGADDGIACTLKRRQEQVR
mgnify:CR=1 FL=1